MGRNAESTGRKGPRHVLEASLARVGGLDAGHAVGNVPREGDLARPGLRGDGEVAIARVLLVHFDEVHPQVGQRIDDDAARPRCLSR